MRRAPNQNGVALVEILIAALILSVSILGTLRLVTSSQQAVTDSGVIAEAQTIAGAVMEVSRYDYSPTNWATRVEDFQTARASVDFAVDSFQKGLTPRSIRCQQKSAGRAGRLRILRTLWWCSRRRPTSLATSQWPP